MTVILKKPPVLYGPDGQPIESRQQAVNRSWNSFTASLGAIDQVPMSRAKNPFGNHVWVYAAIMAIATNAAQAVYTVYRESPDNPATFRKSRLPKAGRRRMAIQRFLQQKQRRDGMAIRGLLPEYDHPLALLMARPNPIQSQAQFMAMTVMLMSLKGACFWLKQSESGGEVGPGEVPAYLWPFSPDFFTPVRKGNSFIGWDMRIPAYLDASGQTDNGRAFVNPHEVVMLAYQDPCDPLGGVSPISAAANGIVTDMMAMAYNKACLSNGSKLGGILLHEEDIDEVEEQKLRTYWKQKHEGPKNANKMAVLTGHFQYIDTGLGPKDMEYLEQRKWDREEIFGALRVSKSVLSLTEGNNYATQLSQDKNFWDKCVMPLLRMIEDIADHALFFTEPDDIVGAFDTSGIEALRTGLKEKVDLAVQLTGTNLHMPPRQAYEIVGLDVKPYDGIDQAVAPASNVRMSSILDGTTEARLQTGNGNNGQMAPAGEPAQPRPSDEGVTSGQ